MNINLLSVNEVKGKRGPRGMEYYKDYRLAIEKSIPFFKENIERNGTIILKAYDLAKEMGDRFADKNHTSLFRGLKIVLFEEGIWLKITEHKNGDKLFMMRFVRPEDRLPVTYENVRLKNQEFKSLEANKQGDK